MADSTRTDIATNRRARRDYEVMDTFEAGIQLRGPEVKALRERKANLGDAYAVIRRGEVFLQHLHISAYDPAKYANSDPLRERKLLLHRREIERLLQANAAMAEGSHLALEQRLRVAGVGLDRLDRALLETLLPLTTLVTPNADEATALTGVPVHTPTDAVKAGRALLKRGCKGVLIKGGHFTEEPATDLLVLPNQVHRFVAPPFLAPNARGTGCSLASAIAGTLGYVTNCLLN